MIASIICGVLAVVCLTQGAVEGAIALGILAVGIYFVFGSQKHSKENKTVNTQSQQKKSQQEKKPEPQHRATPSLIAHYRTSPVVLQIIREIQKIGAEEGLSISKGGHELTARGGGYYQYKFKDHGYQPLTLQEQEAFLRAIVEQLPHAETYTVGYEHVENSTIPLHYFASTSFYRDNQYRWNPETRAWEKMTKI